MAFLEISIFMLYTGSRRGAAYCSRHRHWAKVQGDFFHVHADLSHRYVGVQASAGMWYTGRHCDGVGVAGS